MRRRCLAKMPSHARRPEGYGLPAQVLYGRAGGQPEPHVGHQGGDCRAAMLRAARGNSQRAKCTGSCWTNTACSLSTRRPTSRASSRLIRESDKRISMKIAMPEKAEKHFKLREIRIGERGPDGKLAIGAVIFRLRPTPRRSWRRCPNEGAKFAGVHLWHLPSWEVATPVKRPIMNEVVEPLGPYLGRSRQVMRQH